MRKIERMGEEERERERGGEEERDEMRIERESVVELALEKPIDANFLFSPLERELAAPFRPLAP